MHLRGNPDRGRKNKGALTIKKIIQGNFLELKKGWSCQSEKAR